MKKNKNKLFTSHIVKIKVFHNKNKQNVENTLPNNNYISTSMNTKTTNPKSFRVNEDIIQHLTNVPINNSNVGLVKKRKK